MCSWSTRGATPVRPGPASRPTLAGGSAGGALLSWLLSRGRVGRTGPAAAAARRGGRRVPDPGGMGRPLSMRRPRPWQRVASASRAGPGVCPRLPAPAPSAPRNGAEHSERARALHRGALSKTHVPRVWSHPRGSGLGLGNEPQAPSAEGAPLRPLRAPSDGTLNAAVGLPLVFPSKPAENSVLRPLCRGLGRVRARSVPGPSAKVGAAQSRAGAPGPEETQSRWGRWRACHGPAPPLCPGRGPGDRPAPRLPTGTTPTPRTTPETLQDAESLGRAPHPVRRSRSASTWADTTHALALVATGRLAVWT